AEAVISRHTHRDGELELRRLSYSHAPNLAAWLVRIFILRGSLIRPLVRFLELAGFKGTATTPTSHHNGFGGAEIDSNVRHQKKTVALGVVYQRCRATTAPRNGLPDVRRNSGGEPTRLARQGRQTGQLLVINQKSLKLHVERRFLDRIHSQNHLLR